MALKLAIRVLVAGAVVVVLAATAATAGADVSCTKFASTSGSDRSGDGSFEHPYATPQKLVDSLSAGQTGCFRGGTYQFSLTAVRSARVTLAPYGTESATLKGMIKVLPAGAGATIEGLKLDGVGSNSGCTGTCGGGSPRIYADDVVLRDDEITSEHTGICVLVGSYYSDPSPRNVTIVHNRIHDCGRLPATNHDHGIYISQSRGAIVRDNWIYDNADRGIQLYPDAQGSTITGNVIYGNGEGQNFSCDTTSCSRNNVVAGNVIADSLSWNVYPHSQGATPDGSNVLRDNCMHVSNSRYGSNGGVALDPDFFSSSANLVADPQFEAPGSGDFVLKPSSPCLAKYTGTMSLPAPGSTVPPTNTNLPAISGTAQSGQALSASAGSWSGWPTSYAYRWRRCDSSGSNCAKISGATSKSYGLTRADVGSTMKVVVTANNSDGSASAASPRTAVVAVVVAAVKIKVSAKGRGKGDRAAKGVVSLKSPRTSRNTRPRGAVEMKLYRRSDGGWRAVSKARRARLTPRGRFHKRLRAFRHHRVRPGTYRVRASYPGSRTARPSTSLSRKFSVRA
jgi:parallel beta-helix repeat protein